MKTLLVLILLAYPSAALAATATIQFVDRSENEDGFRVERNLNGGAWTALPVVAPSTGSGSIVQVLDTTLVQSATTANKYCYRAVAFNAAGSSAFAITVTPGVTDCKTISQAVIITIPVPPTGLLVE